MATRPFDIYTSDNDNIFNKVRREIEELFDYLIDRLNERREFLLKQVNQWEEEFNRTRASCVESLQKIRKERDEMELFLSTLKINQAITSLEKGIEDLSNQIIEKEKKMSYPQIRLFFDRNDLEFKISKFGFLSKEINNLLARDLTQLSKPVKVFGTFGEGNREFSQPRGVTIDQQNQRIFIADYGNSRIQVWSMEGEYLSEFGGNILDGPWEIVLSDNFIYISDFHGYFLSKWDFHTFAFVNKSNTIPGPAPGQLNCPAGLDVDRDEIFVVEFGNTRISVFDLRLKFKRIMANDVINHSYCLRVRNDLIYIVEMTGVIKIFSKSDQLLRSILNSKFLSDNICNFNFDFHLNFLMTDCRNNFLLILSPEGNLIHSIDFAKFDKLFHMPVGIDIHKDGRLVICFQNGSKTITIF